MKKAKNQLSSSAFQFKGKMPLKQAIPLGLQHVLAMFVGNLTPLIIITGACGLASGDFASLQLHLFQNAMLVAGIVTLIQLFSIALKSYDYFISLNLIMPTHTNPFQDFVFLHFPSIIISF